MRLPELIDAVKGIVNDPSCTDGLITSLCNTALQVVAGELLLPGLETSATVTVPAGTTSVALPADFHRDLFLARPAVGGQDIGIMDAAIDIEKMRDAPSGNQIRGVATVGSRLLVWPAPGADTVLELHYSRRPHTLGTRSGPLAFSAAKGTITGTSYVFAPFGAGDGITIVGSAGNDGVYTIVAANSMQVTVREPLTDEAAGGLVNVLAEEIEGIPPDKQLDVLTPYVAKWCFEKIEDALNGGKPNSDRFDAMFARELSKLRTAFHKRGLRASTARHETAHIRSLC